MNELDINIFFFQRQMGYCPIHFVHSKLPITPVRYKWILNNTKGRFFVAGYGAPWHASMSDMAKFSGTPAFEDPKDLLMFELSMS